ncbi:enoyl-CoA hydratase/isomerase family protein [Gluconacetobacter tumulisoli]|uniref:Enoyl-CoA hydratase/isomerase family protein n=1 Tax=Gluconacetobacter tumulisoli TaxID=1286189 RepID=A0A7W4K5P1_9PROT|nr:enoyl-CoA hydratase/isomerase family protein [Gluconacetobacter tumulisoli]MBB2200854.1 enoyl-CoA hydratase/isomerase family protein [Gluconacetobacter tumulisoli]
MTAPEDRRIHLSFEDETVVIRIDRPNKLNALDDVAIRDLAAACREIEGNPEVRVAILVGSGEKAFCSGGDIAAWSELSAVAFGRSWIRQGHDAFDALARLRQPLIAVLNGHAFGGGLELAAVADLRVMERHARVGFPETGLGVIPGWSGTQRAVRRFGASVVRRMALFGEILDAEQALTAGIADIVVETGAGIAKAHELGAAVRSRAPVATELVKMLINAAEGEECERVPEIAAGMCAAFTADLAEGVAAFRGKRKPTFKGA